MHLTIIIGTVRSLWMWLWGRYHVTQNAFLVHPKSELISVITLKWYEIGCQLVLITNRKSHAGFQLVPTSVTLNGVIALILHYFTKRPIMSAEYHFPLLATTDPPCGSVSLRYLSYLFCANVSCIVYHVSGE